MSFLLELSFNMKKNTNVSDFIEGIRTCAYNYNCSDFYVNYEIMGKNRTIFRNHCISTITFSEDMDIDLCKFIKEIKKNKNLYIESLYYDNISIKILYVSKKYLSTMPKAKAKEYINKKNKINLSAISPTILKDNL
tara:strand:- start:122 stop:529 length:408 start_codon:yes stop_codon:yes gene_type:complete